MLRGFYTAASGMIAQQRYQETISNNVANANTPGYKADQAALRAFPEMLIRQMGTKHIPTLNGINVDRNRPVGTLNTGSYVQELIPNFQQGTLRETGIYTDMALIDSGMPDETGALFFTVQNESGDLRYTRNGHFTVDGNGYLTANNGYFVLDNNGERILTDDLEFTLTAEGMLQTTDGRSTSLGIAYVENTNDLVKEIDDVYNAEVRDATVIAAEESGAAYQVHQSHIEMSNVDAGQSMTQMIQAYRNFELNQRALRMIDESLGKAVNDIGRIV